MLFLNAQHHKSPDTPSVGHHPAAGLGARVGLLVDDLEVALQLPAERPKTQQHKSPETP